MPAMMHMIWRGLLAAFFLPFVLPCLDAAAQSNGAPSYECDLGNYCQEEWRQSRPYDRTFQIKRNTKAVNMNRPCFKGISNTISVLAKATQHDSEQKRSANLASALDGEQARSALIEFKQSLIIDQAEVETIGYIDLSTFTSLCRAGRDCSKQTGRPLDQKTLSLRECIDRRLSTLQQESKAGQAQVQPSPAADPPQPAPTNAPPIAPQQQVLSQIGASSPPPTATERQDDGAARSPAADQINTQLPAGQTVDPGQRLEDTSLPTPPLENTPLAPLAPPQQQPSPNPQPATAPPSQLNATAPSNDPDPGGYTDFFNISKGTVIAGAVLLIALVLAAIWRLKKTSMLSLLDHGSDASPSASGRTEDIARVSTGNQSTPRSATTGLPLERRSPAGPDSLQDHLKQLEKLHNKLAKSIDQVRDTLAGQSPSHEFRTEQYGTASDSHRHIEEICSTAKDCLQLAVKVMHERAELEIHKNNIASDRDRIADLAEARQVDLKFVTGERDEYKVKAVTAQASFEVTAKQLDDLKLENSERDARERVGLPKFMLNVEAAPEFADLLQKAKSRFPREADRLDVGLRSYAATGQYGADENEYITRIYEVGERLIAMLRQFEPTELPRGDRYKEIIAWITKVNEECSGKCRAYVPEPGRDFDNLEMSSDRSVGRVSGYRSWGVKNSKGIVVFPAKVE
jgi:hypothetical protein